jgi:hypothetical protein
MNEKEAIEYLEDWYLKVPDNKEVHCGVKNHNEVMDTAIAALKEVQEYHATGRTPGMVRALQVAYTRAKKRLDEYIAIGIPEQCREAVERTRWIPVSERMPEGIDACNYIVSIENYGVDIATYVPSVKEWYCLGLPCKVIAWLLLPEPYHITNPGKKEESNVKKSNK